MKKRYYVLALVLLLLLVGIGAYFQYNKPARNLKGATADLSIPATELYKEFSENEAAANAKYLDKIVQVKGSLKSLGRGENGSLNLTLDAGNPMGDVTCEIPAENVAKGTNFQTGAPVTVKGQCTGYLTDVVLVKCVLAE